MRTTAFIAVGALSVLTGMAGLGPWATARAAEAAMAAPAPNSSAFSKSRPSPRSASSPGSASSPAAVFPAPRRLAPPQPAAGQAPPQQATPEASPQVTRQVTPQGSPQGTPEAAPQATHQANAPRATAARPEAAIPYQGEGAVQSAVQDPYGRAALGSQSAAVSPQSAPPEFASAERLLDWVSNYRDRPQYWKVPAAVHAMRDYRLFTDEEQRWFCIGFIAGVLGTNPKDGPGLIPKMFPMPPKEQEVIIRAIAYSGRPDWQDLLVKNAHRMPLRKPLIDDLLNGRRPTLQAMELDTGGTPAVYALWGYYVASGQHEPVMRIMQALKWSKGAQKAGFFEKLTSGWGKDANNVEKVTTGGTAKWTLASYAERDRELIDLYRAEIGNQPEEIAKPLEDVIEAAALFEAEKIRKEQYGAIEDAERRQLTADAGMSKGWTAGSIAIATGCIAASALGQAQIAVPCVIGGALYSGAGKLAR